MMIHHLFPLGQPVCGLLFCRLIVLDYKYDNTHKKQPDSSYTPRDLTCPPALPQPEYRDDPYPTFIIEIAHKHEPWAQLRADARYKAFSQYTSIQIVVGVKIYSKHMKWFWAKRANVGHGMKIMRTTPKMKIDRPTTRVFNLPANLVFWGLPALPPLPTPDFPLRLEALRRRIERYFQ
jgi:hypothetical protein